MQQIKCVFFDIGDTLVHDKAWINGAKATLESLKGVVRLGVISNTESLTRSQLAALLPADFSFNAFEPELVVLSSEVGVKKPAAAIFSLAVKRAGGHAASCLYCSESAVEVLVAQAVGMKGALLPFPPTAGSDLPQLLTNLNKAGLL